MQDLTATFVLSSNSNSARTLFEVPKEFDPSRQRRTHRESRKACESCRRRRVKCSEDSPCINCVRRGERCQGLQRCNEDGNVSTPSRPRQFSDSSSGPNEVVNLLHIRLFHHYETATRQTLLLIPEVWDRVLQLSFNFECLMNAQLCIAARHLACLKPGDAVYPTAAATYLSRALATFRLELSNDLTSTHLDVFVATSVLLQHELWINTDFIASHDNVPIALDLSKDCIFTFSSSLKRVFLNSFAPCAIQASEFLPCIRDNPMDRLLKTARISDDTLAQYHEFFAYNRPLTMEMLRATPPYTRTSDKNDSPVWNEHAPRRLDAHESVEDDYKPVVTRLCLILSFLPESGFSEADRAHLPVLARFILMFPIMCHGPFASMVHRNDPHALLLLYHFYRAVRVLLPSNDYWWAHKRAIALEIALEGWLIECIQSDRDKSGA